MLRLGTQMIERRRRRTWFLLEVRMLRLILRRVSKGRLNRRRSQLSPLFEYRL